MILKEPNTVKLRLSAPTSNTVNIVLMLTSVLGYNLLCSMPTAPYGDRGGGLGVNPLRLTPTLNTTEQPVILDPIDSTCSTKRYDDQCRGQISHAREYIPPWLIPLWPSEPRQVASSSYVTSTGGRALNRPDICEQHQPRQHQGQSQCQSQDQRHDQSQCQSQHQSNQSRRQYQGYTSQSHEQQSQHSRGQHQCICESQRHSQRQCQYSQGQCHQCQSSQHQCQGSQNQEAAIQQTIQLWGGGTWQQTIQLWGGESGAAQSNNSATAQIQLSRPTQPARQVNVASYFIRGGNRYRVVRSTPISVAVGWPLPSFILPSGCGPTPTPPVGPLRNVIDRGGAWGEGGGAPIPEAEAPAEAGVPKAEAPAEAAAIPEAEAPAEAGVPEAEAAAEAAAIPEAEAPAEAGVPKAEAAAEHPDGSPNRVARA